MTGFDLEVLDVPLRVAVQDPVLRNVLAGLLVDMIGPDVHGPDVRATDRGGRTVTVRGTGPWTVEGGPELASRPAAVSAVLAAVNTAAVGGTPHLALHAAVLEHRGGAVVLAAASGTGKTTLTAELVVAGWGYLSDEALGLPWAGGPVVPYPRPLALSDWSAARLGVTGVAAEGEVVRPASALGAVSAAAGLRVAHVVSVHREGRDAGLAPLSRPDALQALWRRGFTHHRDPSRALLVLADLVRGAQCWRWDVGAPGEQATALERLR